jgi:hypothetical protein
VKTFASRLLRFIDRHVLFGAQQNFEPPPRPEDVRLLMDGTVALSERVRRSPESIEPVVLPISHLSRLQRLRPDASAEASAGSASCRIKRIR